MEALLWNTAEFDKFFSCANFSINAIPLDDRRHVLLGVILISLFCILFLLYIPCIISLYWHRDNGCYIFLFYIGVADMLVMFMCGLETGWLGIEGAVFCSYPKLIYTSGAFGMTLWFAETFCELLLAIDRCMELIRPDLANAIFGGTKPYWLCLLPTAYALVAFFYEPPILFSGLYFSWFFNPYVGYKDDFGTIYHSLWHTVHDCCVIFGLSSIYITFSAILCFKTNTLQSASETIRPNFSQKMTFLQVVIISFFNAVASGIYIYMQIFRIGDWLIIVGTYAWLFAHGSPPLIYLSLNRTIRKDCIKMGRRFLKLIGYGKAQHSVAVVSFPVVPQQNHVVHKIYNQHSNIANQ